MSSTTDKQLNLVELKLKYEGEACFLLLNKEDVTLKEVAKHFEKRWRTSSSRAGKYQFQWRDQEGDWVALEDDPTTSRHLRVALDCNESPFIIRCNRLHAEESRTFLDMGFHSLKNEASNSRQQLAGMTCIRTLTDTYMDVMNSLLQLGQLVVKLGVVNKLLVMCKPGDARVAKFSRDLVQWVLESFPHITTYVNDILREDRNFDYSSIQKINPRATTNVKFCSAKERHQEDCSGIDLMITLGGDGTVLFAAWMFQGPAPPIVPFHLGSLGFLTVFDFAEHRHYLQNIFEGGGVRMHLRMRLACTVYRGEKTQQGSSASSDHKHGDDYETARCTECDDGFDSDGNPDGEPETEFHALNELVVDRGANPSMIQLELFVDGFHLTSVLADGLVIASATGSTAYSLSAGGSLVHPEKNSMLVTPICPHTLTCRPFILPGTKRLRICIPKNSRTTGWASFDGRYRQELARGDSITVTFSQFPIMSVCREDQSRDWFRSLDRCLQWNSRRQQKSLNSSDSDG